MALYYRLFPGVGYLDTGGVSRHGISSTWTLVALYYLLWHCVVAERPASSGHPRTRPSVVCSQTLVALCYLHTGGSQHQHLGGDGMWAWKRPLRALMVNSSSNLLVCLL